MKHISSRDNPLYKRVLRLLAGKRGDSDAPELVLEGIHLCQAWLEHQGMPLWALVDADKVRSNTELAALADSLPEHTVIACEPALMQRLSQVVHGQGVLFVVAAPQPIRPSHITQNSLWLDRVQDPGNVGTLLRTAAAAGIRHAYLSPGCASAWSGKVLRSAQGAHFVLTIYEGVDLQAERQRLSIPLVATALHDAGSLYETVLPEKCAWVFGNEGQGVDAQLLGHASLRVFIPQQADVESLNVAVAAGICLFEQRRQHPAHTAR
ncbi:MAG: RNA methyltransferase [Burkholderiaceae bacterium]|nr:RNA methyltransferase [Burkholderiaceae bacterium]